MSFKKENRSPNGQVTRRVGEDIQANQRDIVATSTPVGAPERSPKVNSVFVLPADTLLSSLQDLHCKHQRLLSAKVRVMAGYLANVEVFSTPVSL